MRIYVGYCLSDYATAICMGLDKNSVQKKINSFELKIPTWIESYDLHKNEVVELETD